MPPLVVSIHGGYFMAPYRRDLHVPIVHELVRRGFAVWNVEHRRSGTGGGLRETTDDVWAAVDALPPTAGQVAVFGHSAGGYLAETLATHPRVDLVVPLAGAMDLAGVVRAGWDGGAVAEWLGAGPDEDPARYAAADLLPGCRPAPRGCSSTAPRTPPSGSSSPARSRGRPRPRATPPT